MAETILIIEDEPEFAALVELWMSRAGYRTVIAGSGTEGLRRFYDERPDLIILDVALPGFDGWQLMSRFREFSRVPILMVTARGSEGDKVRGLKLGADDYITKPFSIREFRSRIRAVLRRAGLTADRATDGTIEAGAIAIDPAKRAVTVDGERAQLTYVEFEVLHTLALHPGRVYTRQALLEAVWGDSAYREPRTIDVHIRHLREKIEADPREPAYIFTVRGVGYRFRDTT